MNFFNFIEQMGGGTQSVPQNKPPEIKDEELKRLIQQRQQRQATTKTSEQLKQLLQSREANKDTKLKLKDYLQKQEKNAQQSAAQQPMSGETNAKPNASNGVSAGFDKQYMRYLYDFAEKNLSNKQKTSALENLGYYIRNASASIQNQMAVVSKDAGKLGFTEDMLEDWYSNFNMTNANFGTNEYLVDRKRIISKLIETEDILYYLKNNPNIIDKILSAVENARQEIKKSPRPLSPDVMREYDKVEDYKSNRLKALKQKLMGTK